MKSFNVKFTNPENHVWLAMVTLVIKVKAQSRSIAISKAKKICWEVLESPHYACLDDGTTAATDMKAIAVPCDGKKSQTRGWHDMIRGAKA